MKDFYPFKSGIGLVEPVAIINQNVCLLLSGKKEYRKVTWFEPIPPFQFLDIGAVAAQTQSARTSAVNLQMFAGEFGQFRWWPIDHVQVRMYVPQASGKALLRSIQVPYDDTIINVDPCLHLTEIYVWQDQNPWFEAMNFSDYALNTCRLKAMGYRYMTDPLTQDVITRINNNQEACTFLMATGSSSRPT
jgi:hypothetical protein